MTYPTLFSRETLRHPLFDHVRVILTGSERYLTFTRHKAPGRRPIRGGLQMDVEGDDSKVELHKVTYTRRGQQRATTKVTRVLNLNGHHELQRRGTPAPEVPDSRGKTNFVSLVDRLTGAIVPSDLHSDVSSAIWERVEFYQRHTAIFLREQFPKAKYLRGSYLASVKEVEITWDLPLGKAITFEDFLEILQWNFPTSSIREDFEKQKIIVEAPLADIKFYWKESQRDLPLDLVRCEAVVHNFCKPKTSRYREQIARALKRHRKRHGVLVPTGVRFSNHVALGRRMNALANFVVEQYLLPLCDYSLSHSTQDRLQGARLVMEGAAKSYQTRSIDKVLRLLHEHSGQVPTGLIHWKLKKRLIAEGILKRRKWGRRAYLTVGPTVDAILGIVPGEGCDRPNPAPSLDGHRITGWGHRLGMSMMIA